MRIVLTNFGTTGDFQPFLALAVALRQRGHEPILAFAPHFEAWARKFGFAFAPIGPDLRQVQQEINLAW
ncbi:MAG: glycosyltransferase, partial [Acidobacteria bacterium]|nr:glycosyltransferase [Acidobacteriota bacterium]